MLMFAVQSLLLILAAFIAGAMIACFLRRVFFVRENEHPMPDPDDGRGSKTQQEETHTTTTIKKTTETRTVSATEASRFGRALTGASGAGVTTGVTTSNDNENIETASTDLDVSTSSVDTEPLVPAPLEPADVVTDAQPKSSKLEASQEAVMPAAKSDDASLAAVSGGVADAQQPIDADNVAPQPPAALAPSADLSHRSSGDVAALRSVRSEALVGTEAPVGEDNIFRLPTARGSDVDDLKRIRGIGVLIEKKLNAMGVRTYEQIANWTAGDVNRVSETLDFKGRIERESWIEQARILTSGGYTEFSRRG